MFSWKDKQDGVDDVLAEDINAIANATKELFTTLGDIDIALDHIILVQEGYIRGEEE